MTQILSAGNEGDIITYSDREEKEESKNKMMMIFHFFS